MNHVFHSDVKFLYKHYTILYRDLYSIMKAKDAEALNTATSHWIRSTTGKDYL